MHAGFTESTRAASYLVPSGRVHESGGVYLLTAFVHLPYSPHDHPGGIGREKMPSVENAVGRVQGSGPPHYSGIRFGLRFRVPIRSHPINIAESPEYGRPPPVGGSPNRVRSGRLPIRSHSINPIRSSPAGGVRELHGSGRCTLPFRGGNIEGRPAGGGPGFSRDGRHVSGYGPGSGRAARAVRGRCGRLRAALWRLRDALPGSTGNGFVSGALLPLVASPGGMRRPHILRSVEELRIICRVFGRGGSWNVAICCGPASSLFVGSVFQYGSPCFASG